MSHFVILSDKEMELVIKAVTACQRADLMRTVSLLGQPVDEETEKMIIDIQEESYVATSLAEKLAKSVRTGDEVNKG